MQLSQLNFAPRNVPLKSRSAFLEAGEAGFRIQRTMFLIQRSAFPVLGFAAPVLLFATLLVLFVVLFVPLLATFGFVPVLFIAALFAVVEVVPLCVVLALTRVAGASFTGAATFNCTPAFNVLDAR